MIVCPNCKVKNWQLVFKSPTNPEEDCFYCNTCNKAFSRYGKKQYKLPKRYKVKS